MFTQATAISPSRSCTVDVIFNSLRPVQNGWHFAEDMNKIIQPTGPEGYVIGIWEVQYPNTLFLNKLMGISCEIALMWKPLDTCGMSLLIRVMAWFRQATNHYMNQSWPRYMSRNYVTRPQCFINEISLKCSWRSSSKVFIGSGNLLTTNSHDGVIKLKHFPRYWPCGEFTAHRWIPLTKAIDAELWCFLWYAPD